MTFRGARAPGERAAEAPLEVDVAVLAGDAFGLGAAFELARRGATTAVFLQGGAPAIRFTDAAVVSPQALLWNEPQATRDLAIYGEHLFSEWIEAIEAASGLSCDYDTRGGIAAAGNDDEEVALDRGLDWQREVGLPIEVLTGEEASQREPSLCPDWVTAAFFLPSGGQISGSRLLRALLLALADAGAVLEPGVRSLSSGPSGSWNIEAGRRRVRAAALVDATAGSLPPLGLPRIPVFQNERPFVVLDSASLPVRLTRFILSHQVTLVPERSGYIWILGQPGVPAGVQAAVLGSLLESASRLLPSLAALPFEATGSLLEPVAPDGLPLLGETPAAGLFVLRAFGRHGLVMAPAAASLVADLLTGRKPAISVSAFSPYRFRV